VSDVQVLSLSPLAHTWVLDLDGTILRHNGYLGPNGDSLLEGAAEFMSSIPPDDLVIFVTSRPSTLREMTETFLVRHRIRYNHLVFDAPYGERILINDHKPSGLRTAIAIDHTRDAAFDVVFEIDASK